MRSYARVLAAVMACAFGCAGARADLVVRNARIYTVDAARPWATALAVKSGRLVVGYPLTWAATERTIRTCVASARTRSWILISNANTAALPDQGLTLRELDAFERDRPLVIDADSSFVNSAALRAANITAKTPDPSDGRIVRDASGAPTGTLLEGAKVEMEAWERNGVGPHFDRNDSPRSRLRHTRPGEHRHEARGWRHAVQ